MNELISVFNSNLFVIISGIGTTIIIISFSYGFYLWVKGIIPVFYRIGVGLSRRKIAIFACGEKYESLNDLIKESRIFNKTIQINQDNIKKAENETIFLVHWSDYKEKIDEIISIKKTSTSLIVYAPYKDKISEDDLEKINSQPNSIIVNFRGRLLNDIFTSVITTK